ncbi:MAG: alkene reductase [Cyanobacteria bacterium P01_A01_bin.17]
MQPITPDLFTPIDLGPLTLPSRIVMAPLTRMRAGEGNAPTPMNATYYAQRASAGLIITEATQVSRQGRGYANSPGIHSPEQMAGWKLVTKAVHAAGGQIFLQLWHAGRTSHPDLQENGALPVAPSAIAAEGHAYTPNGRPDLVTPRALKTEEIPGIVEQFRQGAANALAVGFDGVEVHGANGYLIDEFLEDGSNKRSDRYGGSVANRARFLLEVMEAVIQVWGKHRVGVRLSPSGQNYSMSDSDRATTFEYAVDALNTFDLAYFHLMEPNPQGEHTDLDAALFRPIFKGTLMANGGYDRQRGDAVLANDSADLVSFGRTFLANPDLPERLALNASLNDPDSSTFYGGGEKGYTDYPSLKKR